MSQASEDGAVTEPERARALGFVCRAGAIALVVVSVVALIGSWAMLGLGTIGEAKALGMLVLAVAGLAGAVLAAAAPLRVRGAMWLAGGAGCAVGWYAAYFSIG